jgi:hypothetical protein
MILLFFGQHLAVVFSTLVARASSSASADTLCIRSIYPTSLGNDTRSGSFLPEADNCRG